MTPTPEQALIAKLEHLKATPPERLVRYTYLETIDECIAVIRQHTDAPVTTSGKFNRYGVSCEISVVDDAISNALECANLFVLKNCHLPKSVEVIQAINAGRDALRLHKPVSVSLEKAANKMQDYGLESPLYDYEYKMLARSCAEAWGLKHVD